MKEQISSMIQAVLDEEVSACEVYGELDQLEKQIKAAKLQIRGGTFSEAREFNKGENYHGGTWLIKNTGTKLNYIEDTDYKSMAESLADRVEILKNAWKAKQDPNNFFKDDYIYTDEDTGEEVPIVSVKTAAGESITFTPSKSKGPTPTDDGKKLIFD